MQTLTDLSLSFQLYAVCVPCQRMERLPLAGLIDRLGPEFLVTDLRSKLRCKRCQARTEDLRIVYVGPCESAAGFHYRASPDSRTGATDARKLVQ